MAKRTVQKKERLSRDKNDVVIYCDGFLKNKEHSIDGTGGCSVAIIINDEKVFIKTFAFPNNRPYTRTRKITVPMMEYFAVHCAMMLAHSFNQLKKIVIYSDAETIVNQVNDLWAVNNKVLKKWYSLVQKEKSKNIQLLWIKRDANVRILGH